MLNWKRNSQDMKQNVTHIDKRKWLKFKNFVINQNNYDFLGCKISNNYKKKWGGSRFFYNLKQNYSTN